MRRLLFIIPLLLTFSITVSSQSFVSKDNKWIIEETYWMGGSSVKYRIYWFKEAVEIDGVEYLHLHRALLGSPEIEATGVYLREENSQVYRIEDGNGQVNKIYDFSSDKGDILILKDIYHQSVEGDLLEVNSLALLDGNYVTSFEVDVTDGLSRLQFEDTFIENIGSTTYPFHPGSFAHDFKQSIACYYQRDTLLYSSESDLSFCSQFGDVPPEVSSPPARFVNRDNRWVLNEVKDENDTFTSKHFEYWFNHHQVINGVTYLELIKSEMNSSSEIPTGQFYREKNNKVYHYNGIEESLVYDFDLSIGCLLYTSPSPRDATLSRMPSSA